MTASALIAHVLDPLIDPQFAEQDSLYDKAFGSGADLQSNHDYLRGYKRSPVDAMDWAGDKLLISGSKDATMRLFDVERGEKERSWSGDWMALQTDPNQPWLAAAVAWSGRFRVFDTRSSTSHVYDVDLKKSSGSLKEFLCLCWSPDSKHIAVSNRADQVYLLDLRVAAQLRLGASYTSHSAEVTQMAWSQEGDSLWLATGGSPGKLTVLPAPSLNADGAVSLLAHQYYCIAVAADPTGRYIASGGGDCLVTLWDPKHLCCVRSFGFATQGVAALGFNHTGNLLAWGTGSMSHNTGGEKNLTIVGANTGQLYLQDPTPAPVQLVKWHPTRNVLAYALNPAALPDERDAQRDRRIRDRDMAVVHTLKVPDSA